MKKPKKMNGMFKAAFILMLVCAVLLVASIVVSYALDKVQIAVLIAVGGAVLCVVAIILAMFSKPKQPKPLNNISEEELTNTVDNEEIL